MSFGFPAYSTGTHKFNVAAHELERVICEALDSVGWRYEHPSPNKFMAKHSANIWSWGEKIAIDVSHDGTVMARSECALVTQCFDWGKNGRNVRAFFDEVARLIAASSTARPST